jgi:hypothetical protein
MSVVWFGRVRREGVTRHEDRVIPPLKGDRGLSLSALDGIFKMDIPRRLKPAAPLKGGILW